MQLLILNPSKSTKNTKESSCKEIFYNTSCIIRTHLHCMAGQARQMRVSSSCATNAHMIRASAAFAPTVAMRRLPSRPGHASAGRKANIRYRRGEHIIRPFFSRPAYAPAGKPRGQLRRRGGLRPPAPAHTDHSLHRHASRRPMDDLKAV